MCTVQESMFIRLVAFTLASQHRHVRKELKGALERILIFQSLHFTKSEDALWSEYLQDRQWLSQKAYTA